MSAPSDTRVRMTHEEFLTALAAQGVAMSGDYAFRCVVCGTVQSMRSWVAAGESTDTAEVSVGFSCVGRARSISAGAWDDTPARRLVPGCDWTLGGLFGGLGREIVVTRAGKDHVRFQLASPAEAQELARRGGQSYRPDGAP